MKFTKDNLDKDNKDRIEQQQKKEAKLVHVGTIIPHQNHTLFKVNIQTHQVSKAEYEISEYYFTGTTALPLYNKVIIEEGYEYISALNKKNALKKFLKGDNGTKLDTSKDYLNIE